MTAAPPKFNPMNSSLHSRTDTGLPAGLPARTWFARRARHGGRESLAPARRPRVVTAGLWMVLVLVAPTAAADTTDDYFWEVIGGCRTIC